MELSSGFVVLMGLGTVFVGLICIILICTVMGWLCKGQAEKEKQQTKPASNPAASAPAAGTPAIANRSELVAAISVALAEQLGTGVSAIRIVSLKKLS